MKKGYIGEGIVSKVDFPNKGTVITEEGESVIVKNTIPGDLPSSNLKEIDSIIKNHQSTGPQLEMNR